MDGHLHDPVRSMTAIMANNRILRWSGALGACAIVAMVCPAHADPRAVIELFTSQGCSSCPPADKVIGEFSKDPDVIALSMPIDYWDYLGWKDTLADSRFSARQKAYSYVRGDRDVYTPQVIVNGSAPVIGSDRAGIEGAIDAQQEVAAARQVHGHRDARPEAVGRLHLPQVAGPLVDVKALVVDERNAQCLETPDHRVALCIAGVVRGLAKGFWCVADARDDRFGAGRCGAKGLRRPPPIGQASGDQAGR